MKRVMTHMLAVLSVSFNREVQCTINSRCVNLLKEFKTARMNVQESLLQFEGE